MASFEINQTVDLATGAEIDKKAFTTASVGDRMAHQWNVTILRNGVPANLAGATIAAYMKREDSKRVFLIGTAIGNVATVQFPSATYAVPGAVEGFMRITQGTTATTVARVRISIGPNLMCEIIDPGQAIPNIEDLLILEGFAREAAAAAEAAANKAEEAADKANAAAEAAYEVARKWNSVEVKLTMLPPDGEASVRLDQSEDKTTLSFELPQGRVTNATLYVDDETTELIQRMPITPEVGIDYYMDPDTTELFQRAHGY